MTGVRVRARKNTSQKAAGSARKDASEKAAHNLNHTAQAAHPMDLACLYGLVILSGVMQNGAIYNAQAAGNAIWQSVLTACTLGGGFAFLIHLVLRTLPGDAPRDWFTLTRELSGNTGARVSAVAMLVLFFDTAKATVLSMETTATNEYLGQTPLWIIAAVGLFVCAVGARKGLRGTVRCSRLMLAIGAGIVALILVVAWSAYDLNALFPFFGYGLDKTVGVGIRMGGDSFADLLVLCLILPVQRGQRGTGRGVGLSIALGVSLLLPLALCYAMAYPVTVRYLAPPIQQLALMSESGRYLQRLSPLLVFVWAGAFFAGLSAMLFGISRSWAALFHLPDEQPLVWAFAALLFVIALIPYDILPRFARERLSGYIRIGLFLLAVLPALMGSARMAWKGRAAAKKRTLRPHAP